MSYNICCFKSEVLCVDQNLGLNLSKQTSGDSGSNVKRLEEETQIKIEQLKNEASKVSPEVVAMLMKYVTTVRN